MNTDKLKFIVFPLISTLCLYLAFTSVFDLHAHAILKNLLSLDFLLQLGLGYLLFAFSRNEMLFPLVQAIVMGSLYLASVVKINYFSGVPFSPYDIPSVLSLISILPLMMQILTMIVVALVSALFLYNLKINKNNAYAAVALVISMPLAFSTYAVEIKSWLDNRYPRQIWDKGYNYHLEGGDGIFHP